MATRESRWLESGTARFSKPRLLAIALASVVLTGAASENASRKDIDECTKEASRTASANPDAAPVTQAEVSPNDPHLFDAVAACLRSKGYMRVQDIGGVCDDFILPQCFERN
ncbi:hypothetical protein [Mesorhizobium sp. CN2-181]|uniref:hypothetical protein n=1 Tax=Mesorhizobium yinganensis TaxID=3157707 RepID=UPI0032B7A321